MCVRRIWIEKCNDLYFVPSPESSNRYACEAMTCGGMHVQMDVDWNRDISERLRTRVRDRIVLLQRGSTLTTLQVVRKTWRTLAHPSHLSKPSSLERGKRRAWTTRAARVPTVLDTSRSPGPPARLSERHHFRLSLPCRRHVNPCWRRHDTKPAGGRTSAHGTKKVTMSVQYCATQQVTATFSTHRVSRDDPNQRKGAFGTNKKTRWSRKSAGWVRTRGRTPRGLLRFTPNSLARHGKPGIFFIGIWYYIIL
jgi:hypothetical protein